MSRILFSPDEARERINDKLHAVLFELEQSMDALLRQEMRVYFEHVGSAAHFALSASEHVEQIDHPAFLYQLKNTILKLGAVTLALGDTESTGALLLETAVLVVDTLAVLSGEAAVPDLVQARKRIADKYIQLSLDSCVC